MMRQITRQRSSKSSSARHGDDKLMVAARTAFLGAGFYEGALIAFLCAVLTITIVHRLEYTINKRYSRFGIYIEIKGDSAVRNVIDILNEKFKVSDIQVTTPRSGTVGNVGIEANVHNRDFSTSPEEVARTLESEETVVFAIESL